MRGRGGAGAGADVWWCHVAACVSPADSSLEETLTTLKYAQRARSIQNNATVTGHTSI